MYIEISNLPDAHALMHVFNLACNVTLASFLYSPTKALKCVLRTAIRFKNNRKMF